MPKLSRDDSFIGMCDESIDDSRFGVSMNEERGFGKFKINRSRPQMVKFTHQIVEMSDYISN